MYLYTIELLNLINFFNLNSFESFEDLDLDIFTLFFC